MTLRHLRIFVEVCRTGSITKAAESLHLSQPAVSLAIRQLEEYYGILLFDRISKKLYLTESGNKMLSYASHIIESFDDMETQLKNWDSAGTLRIGSSISTGTQMLPQLVRRFNLRFPQIRTQVLIDNSRIIEDKVLTNQLDMALVESLSYSPDIVCVPFYTDRLIVITAPMHPLTQSPKCTVKALADYPVLLREPGSGTREVVDALLVTAEVQITPLWESTSTRSIINAVKAVSYTHLDVYKRQLFQLLRRLCGRRGGLSGPEFRPQAQRSSGVRHCDLQPAGDDDGGSHGGCLLYTSCG